MGLVCTLCSLSSLLSLLLYLSLLGARVLVVGLCVGRFLPLWCGRSLIGLAACAVRACSCPCLCRSFLSFWSCSAVSVSSSFVACVVGSFFLSLLSLFLFWPRAALLWIGLGSLGNRVLIHPIHVNGIH